MAGDFPSPRAEGFVPERSPWRCAYWPPPAQTSMIEAARIRRTDRATVRLSIQALGWLPRIGKESKAGLVNQPGAPRRELPFYCGGSWHLSRDEFCALGVYYRYCVLIIYRLSRCQCVL
jgi:hypothetical protein